MVECPHCNLNIEDYVEDFTDWLYNNDLYQEGEQDVVCPSCDEEFVIRAIPSFEYESYISEIDEDDFSDDDQGYDE